MEERSVYVHVPFCVSRCSYCDFVSSTGGEEEISAYFSALEKEIALKAERYGKSRVPSIYFGGGTPSRVDEKYIGRVLSAIAKYNEIEHGAEITVECNPESVTDGKLAAYKRFGVNRISLGVQSFSEEELKAVSRAHTPKQAEDALLLVKKHFGNFSADLMLGLPKQTTDSLVFSIERLAAFSPPHISLYALTLMENTKLFCDVMAGRASVASDDAQADMYERAYAELTKRGYERYEVSNYCRGGAYSRHNMRYWTGGEYLGFGVSASELLESSRLTATSDRKTYIEKINGGALTDNLVETLSEKDRETEFIILSLRTARGLDKAEFCRRFNADFCGKYRTTLDKFAYAFDDTAERIAIKQRYFFVMSEILCEFV